MTEIILTLPYPPSVNHAYKTVRRKSAGGRPVVIKTADTEAFQWQVRAIVAQQGAHQHLHGRLSVSYTVCPPDRRKRDIANVEKVLSDALQYAGVFHDDSQIDRLLIERGRVMPDGCIVARIQEVRSDG